ncbi:MAG: hypothetical protein CVT89_01860 [Candidatus Altiarchaeales archaeon HGW-Altiarchaeales-2]|nr:MAG: hypothetical protein CVT89_01860 [Candidatus Altiarchaeales archaeon HGW-Altiarchaeales-2]
MKCEITKIIIGLLLILVIFISGCIQTEDEEEYQNDSEELSSDEKSNDSVIQRAEPYMTKIIFKDKNLRSKAASIAGDCPSGDKECQLNKIYLYIVENYKYYSDPTGQEYIQSPDETMDIKGGDCEDLTILLNSLLENIGIKTYIVLTDNHTYSLTCGINTKNMEQYVKEDVVAQFSKDIEKRGYYKVVIEDENLFIVSEKKETFVLPERYNYYYGSNISNFTAPIDFMNIKYNISSSQPLTVYVVPTKNDFALLSKDDTFTHYASCKKQNILKTSESCGHLSIGSGLVLVNNNSNDATVDLGVAFYYSYSTSELMKDKEISYYQIDGQQCVILESTAGKYGYPGYIANSTGEKIAVDPITKKYTHLK